MAHFALSKLGIFLLVLLLPRDICLAKEQPLHDRSKNQVQQEEQQRRRLIHRGASSAAAAALGPSDHLRGVEISPSLLLRQQYQQQRRAVDSRWGAGGSDIVEEGRVETWSTARRSRAMVGTITTTECSNIRTIASFQARLDMFYLYKIEYENNHNGNGDTEPDLPGIERALATALATALDRCDDQKRPAYAIQLSATQGHELTPSKFACFLVWCYLMVLFSFSLRSRFGRVGNVTNWNVL